MVLDTCFLVDLERKLPECYRFLESYSTELLYITHIILGELLRGIETHRVTPFLAHLNRFEVLPLTEAASICYGSIYQSLKRRGQMVVTNDLWIAAVACANRMPVVTRNTVDFSRIPGISIITY